MLTATPWGRAVCGESRRRGARGGGRCDRARPAAARSSARAARRSRRRRCRSSSGGCSHVLISRYVRPSMPASVRTRPVRLSRRRRRRLEDRLVGLVGAATAGGNAAARAWRRRGRRRAAAEQRELRRDVGVEREERARARWRSLSRRVGGSSSRPSPSSGGARSTWRSSDSTSAACARSSRSAGRKR